MPAGTRAPALRVAVGDNVRVALGIGVWVSVGDAVRDGVRDGVGLAVRVLRGVLDGVAIAVLVRVARGRLVGDVTACATTFTVCCVF